MKPIWTGAIGFGLVNIPVKLYSATKSSNLDLDMLDKKDHANIKFLRVNEKTGKSVTWENIVKEDEISSIYYETPYYIEPDKSGTRAYELLLQALKKTGKVGIATFVMRSKESLAVLRPDLQNVLVLNRIRFEEEISDAKELTLPEHTTVKPAELQMAVSLINQLSGKFDVSKYKDTYRDELLKLIHAKAKGQKIKAPQMKVVHSKTKDLMSQLKASLDVKRKKAS